MKQGLEIVRIAALEDNYIWLVHDPASGDTAVIDPALAVPVLDTAIDRNWSIRQIWNTHWHADHIGGNDDLRRVTGATIFAPARELDRIPDVDIGVGEGDRLRLGRFDVEVWDIPGHTLGHVAYHIPDAAAIFVGDTLFAMGCGRLFEGNADQMWANMQRFAGLADATRVYCAHEYTLANAHYAVCAEPENEDIRRRLEQIVQMRMAGEATVPTTIGLERSTNPFMRARSAEILADRRAARNRPLAEVA